MFLDTHYLSLPAVSTQSSYSEEEYDRLSSNASHCCPNCDGDITIGEHEDAGMCNTCYFGLVAS